MAHDKSLFVLSIEDSETESSLLRQELEKHNGKFKLKIISRLTDLEEQLHLKKWNLIISNYQLKDFTAKAALDVVKRHQQEVPFILFSESIGEEVVADMMKAGVEDFVSKSRPERLTPVLKRIIRDFENHHKEAHAHQVAHEAYAAKEQMLAIVSHDIKNPLSAIQLEAQMLIRAAERNGKSLLGEEVKIQANRILKTTERMKILISDLLDRNKSENSLSRITKEEVHIMRLVLDVLDSLRPLIQEKEIIIKTMIAPECVVNIDRNKMFQVISNLVNNAIKFTPVNGFISIKIEEHENELIFTVEDSGPGLQDEELKKVFEKYWTGSAADCSGTGLGLFICKTIVEAHGGRIFVENGESGARFRFSIPGKNLQHAASRSTDSRKQIYIVDDDEDLREVIGWALGKEGYAVHSFSSPTEALISLEKSSHAPHLIVVDYHMDEMKGSDFILKKNKIFEMRECPVVMISASPTEVEEEVSASLYKDIITKPIDLEGLVMNVRKFLQ